MPYCTRCGKPIQEGERCNCTKKNGLNFKFSSDSTAGSLSFGSAGRNPDVQYERGQKIVPDNIAPNESEIPVRQYNLCVMRSRIKGARAEGRLQLTNKRILFRAKGTAPVGETTIQHEFSIDEVAGFQIVRNFRFSILDLLLIFALSVAIGYIGVGFGGFLGRTLKAFGQLLVYVLALAVAVPAFVWMPQEQYAGKCVFLSASVGLFTVLREMIYFKSSFLTVLSQIFIYVPYLIFGVLLAACVFAFAFKPNMEFLVRTKTGEAVIPIRCEKTGFAALGNVIDAQYMGYNEVLPTDETEKAIREIGAIINDIQKLGDYGIAKWKTE